VSVPRVSHVVNLQFAAWPWCFGSEKSRLHFVWTRALLPLWRELMPQDRARAPQSQWAVLQHAVSYSWTPGRRAAPTKSFVQQIPPFPSLIRLGTEPCSGLPPELQKSEIATTTSCSYSAACNLHGCHSGFFARRPSCWRTFRPAS